MISVLSPAENVLVAIQYILINAKDKIIYSDMDISYTKSILLLNSFGKYSIIILLKLSIIFFY